MNTTTRIGKIARLPHSIREKLNLKLNDGIPAKFILPWLNSLPETKAIVAAEFDDRPISKQNLSEWKHGGFRDWLLQFNAANFLQFMDIPSSSSSSSIPPANVRDGGEQTHDLSSPLTYHASHITDIEHATANTSASDNSSFCIPQSSLTARLLLWTQLQYISMARSIDSESDPDRKWSALRHFANDVSRLKRSFLADDYLQIQRDWLALSQSNTADKKEKQFWAWTKRPDIEKQLFPDRRRGLTAEELYQFEKDCYLLDDPGPEIAELMAEVRIAKKLLEIRKAQEAESKAKAAPDYDPNRPLPNSKVKLAGMPFEEIFPTIPDKPLTETHPELDDLDPTDRSKPEDATASGYSSPSVPSPHLSDPSYKSDPSHPSDSVKPSPTQSNQIQPPPPLNTLPHPNPDNPTNESPSTAH